MIKTKTDMMREYIAKHPNATAAEVAEATGATVSGVRGMASRFGWSISTPKAEPTRADDDAVLYALRASEAGEPWRAISRRIKISPKAAKCRVEAVRAEILAGKC